MESMAHHLYELHIILLNARGVPNIADVVLLLFHGEPLVKHGQAFECLEFPWDHNFVNLFHVLEQELYLHKRGI